MIPNTRYPLRQSLPESKLVQFGSIWFKTVQLSICVLYIIFFCFIRVLKNSMSHFHAEIERLKLEVEKQVGRHLRSPCDFDLLSFKVNEKIHERISTSTIKRLWGYITTTHKPRLSTLSILARYVGFMDWDNFSQSKTDKENDLESSNY